MSKIEVGKMELDLADIDMSELLYDIADAVAPMATTGNNVVTVDIAPTIGRLYCDAAKFRSMTGQLLDNALKFTQDGNVTVVALRQPGKVGDDLIVHVTDTGIGIAPDQITSLFEKFTVADDSSTSKYGGTGLGLALSQKLCKLMGGEILVESTLGAGSRFTVRMPLIESKKTSATSASDIYAAATLVPDDAPVGLTLKPMAV